MRFIRSNHTWQVVEAFSGEEYCLEELAFKKCYRVADLCRALGCSHRYLYVVFMRDIGLPPKHWMNLERMVVARRKLVGGKSAREVASDLGFLSVESFRRRFYKVYRISPLRFVKRIQVFDPTKPLPTGPPPPFPTPRSEKLVTRSIPPLTEQVASTESGEPGEGK